MEQKKPVIADPKAIAARKKDGQKIEQNQQLADKQRKPKSDPDSWRREHIKV